MEGLGVCNAFQAPPSGHNLNFYLFYVLGGNAAGETWMLTLELRSLYVALGYQIFVYQ